MSIIAANPCRSKAPTFWTLDSLEDFERIKLPNDGDIAILIAEGLSEFWVFDNDFDGTVDDFDFVSGGCQGAWVRGSSDVNVMLFGGDPSGETDSTEAFRSAFSLASALGQNLLIPAGHYITTPGASMNIGVNTPTVFAWGAHLRDLKIAITGTHQTWLGGVFTTNGVGVNANEVIHLSGTDTRLHCVTVDYSNQSGGVSVEAYCAIEIAAPALRVKVTNFDLWVQGRVGMAVNLGTDITISQGKIQCTDDGIALKGAGGTLSNVTIDSVEVQGAADIVAFGTETTILTNVTVTNCTAFECQTAIWIKPGRVDYPNALLENVTISNIDCRDILGNRYQRAIYITCNAGAIIRNLIIDGVTVVARCNATSLTRAFVHLFPNASSILDVSIKGCRFRDAEGGAVGVNGFPVLFGLYIEPLGASVVSNLLFDDVVVDGTGGAGFINDDVGTISNVRLSHLRFRNNNNGTGDCVIQANMDGLIIDENLVIENQAGLANPIRAAAGYSIQCRRENIRVKDMAAGVSHPTLPLMEFVRKAWVSKISVISSSDVLVDAINYTELNFINATSSITMTSLVTNVTPIVACVPQPTSANVLDVAASIQDAGSVLRFSKLEHGAGQTLNDLIIAIDHVPYGE